MNETNPSRLAVRAAYVAAALFIIAFARFFVLLPEGRGNVVVALLSVVTHLLPLPSHRGTSDTAVGPGRQLRLARRGHGNGHHGPQRHPRHDLSANARRGVPLRRPVDRVGLLAGQGCDAHRWLAFGARTRRLLFRRSLRSNPLRRALASTHAALDMVGGTPPQMGDEHRHVVAVWLVPERACQ
jgi:hypothetical protein